MLLVVNEAFVAGNPWVIRRESWVGEISPIARAGLFNVCPRDQLPFRRLVWKKK